MSRDFKFDYEEFEKYVRNFEKMTKDFEKFLKTFLLEQAQRCVNEAKKNTPVDTGALRASWGIGSQTLVLKSSLDEFGKQNVSIDTENSTIADISVVGDNFEVTIWNGMEYASYVEYGHRTTGGGYVQGVFMLTISIDKVSRAIPSRFQRAFKQFLNERGVT